MNFRYGIIFLVVAIVCAVGQVSSEEAEAETMVRREAEAAGMEEMHGESKRSPDPLNFKRILDMARLGRSADPNLEKFVARLKKLKGRKAARSASADPDPDPGMLDFLKNIPFIGGLMR